MPAIFFIVLVFLAGSALFKHIFNTALESATKHLIPPMSKKNIHHKSRLISICIAVAKRKPIFLEKIFQKLMK